ncbi:MAG: hypothetical protein ACJAYC_000012 [Halieaceae bacterium]|jgi:hypothetical protein
MTNPTIARENESTQVGTRPVSQAFVEWMQEPLGSVLFAAGVTISTFGFVLSGMWLIHLALN